MGRRRADIWDDFFEALRWLFSVIHPASCIPLAACFFFLPGLWLRYKAPQMQMLGWLIGFVAAMVSLAAGVAGWKLRQQRAAFHQQHLDINWLNNLSWQDFEAGGGGAVGGIDLRRRRDGRPRRPA